MGTVTAMLAEARKHIGYREGRTTMFGVWYGDQVKSSAYDGAAWCDMFLAYCASKTSNLPAVFPGGLRAYTPWHVGDFQKAGRWHAGKAGIRAGDIVFFDWDGGVVDHVGIVEKVLSGGRVQTIEGNTADACLRRIRVGSIKGYGRPAYAPKPAPSPAARPWPGRYYQLASPMTRGDNVRWIQDRLNAKGASPKLAEDGVFGPKTDREVRDYQKAHRLDVDGIVGPRTWASLAK